MHQVQRERTYVWFAAPCGEMLVGRRSDFVFLGGVVHQGSLPSALLGLVVTSMLPLHDDDAEEEDEGKRTSVGEGERK